MPTEETQPEQSAETKKKPRYFYWGNIVGTAMAVAHPVARNHDPPAPCYRTWGA